MHRRPDHTFSSTRLLLVALLLLCSIALRAEAGRGPAPDHFAGATFGWTVAEFLQAYPEAELVGEQQRAATDQAVDQDTQRYRLEHQRGQRIYHFHFDRLVEVHLNVNHALANSPDNEDFIKILRNRLEQSFVGSSILVTVEAHAVGRRGRARTARPFIHIEAVDQAILRAAEEQRRSRLQQASQQLMDEIILAAPPTAQTPAED